MKVAATLAAMVMLAGQASAKWNSCGLKDYQTVFVGLAQGVGVDPLKVDTDCVVKATLLGDKTKKFVDSFSTLKMEDWAAPLYLAAEQTTQATEVFTACQTTNLAKQFAVRANSLGGLFDMISTVGVAFLMEYVTKPGKSKLYNAFKGFNDATTCQATMVEFGKSVQYLFSYQAQPADYANQLPQDLVSDVIG